MPDLGTALILLALLSAFMAGIIALMMRDKREMDEYERETRKICDLLARGKHKDALKIGRKP